MPFFCTSIQMPGPYSGYTVPDKVPAFFHLSAACWPHSRHASGMAFGRRFFASPGVWGPPQQAERISLSIACKSVPRFLLLRR